MHFAALDELIEAQAITAVALGQFTKPAIVSAVIIKSDRLELYEWHPPALRLVCRQHFAGPILECVRLPNFAINQDGLLIVFSGCRHATLLFSSATSTFQTTSLHQFDEDRFKTEHICELAELTIHRRAVCDPAGRCAVLRVFRDYLSVVPFERIDFESGNEPLPSSPSERLPSWTTRFLDVDPRLQCVLDWYFLEGYSEPTLGLLLETSGHPVWSGRIVSGRKDGRAYAIVTINLRTQAISLIHYQDGLPSDLCRLFGCRKPIGGCFAVGVSCLVHLDQGTSGCGYAVNGFAASKLSDYRFLPILSPLECTMENSYLVHITGDLCWIFLANGRRLTLRVSKGSRSVNNLVVGEQPPGPEHFPVSACAVYEGFLLLGSDCADCLFYQTMIVEQKPVTTSDKVMESGSSLYDENELYLAEMEAEERLRTTVTTSGSAVTLLDRLESPGALTSTCCAMWPANPERPVTTRTPRVLVGITGRGCSAPAVAVFSPHLPVRETARFAVPHSIASYSVVGSGGVRFLLVSTISSTLVLQVTEKRMTEVEESDFFLEGATITAGTIISINESTASSSLIVQVHRAGIRLLEGVRMVHEQSLTNCVAAQVFRHFVVTISGEGLDQVYKVDQDGISLVHSGSACKTAGMFEYGQSALYYRLTEDGLFAVSDGLDCVFSSNVLGMLPIFVDNGMMTAEDPIVPDHLSVCSSGTSVHIAISSCNILAVYSNVDQSRLRFVKTEARSLQVSQLCPLSLGDSTFGFSVFTGSRTHIIHIGLRCYPRIHHLLGNIVHMSPGADNGLLLVDRSSRVRISTIDPRFDIDRSDCCLLLSRIISDDCLEPRRIVYLPTVHAFVVACRSVTNFRLPSDEYSADADHPDFEYLSSAPCPHGHHYSLHVLSPITWTLTDRLGVKEQPGCSEYDVIVDLKVCILTTKSTQSGRKPLVVAATASLKGEDRPVRGRALVLDVTDVVPEPGRPETNRRLRLLASSDVKTTVGTICELRGAVLVSQGMRIIVHAFENDDSLLGIAFVDSAIFSGCAASLGGLFALGDVHRGVSLYAFQEEPPRIVQIARALDCPMARTCVTGIQFLPGTEDALIVSGDQQGGLYLHAYAPKHPRSLTGSRLIVRGTLRLPAPIVSLERVVDCVYVLLANGAISRLSHVEQATFRRCNALMTRAVSALPQPGGLSPRVARSLQPPLAPSGALPVAFPRNILDRTICSELLLARLSIPQQLQLASAAMLDWSQVILDLRLEA